MFRNSLIFFLLCCSSISIYGQHQNFSGLTMTVQVRGTELEKRNENDAIKVLLYIEFKNDSDRKILLLNKYAMQWGRDILRSESGDVLYYQAGGMSFFQREKVRTHLLSLELPSSEVRELNPGETFGFDDYTNILIDKKDDGLGGSKILKDDIIGLNAVWLRFRYTFWDPNLDLELSTMKKLGFGTQLRNKWENFGILWTAPIEAAPVKIELPVFGDENSGITVEQKRSNLQSPCQNSSDEAYEPGKIIRSLAEMLNRRMPSFREYEPQGFGEKGGRPIRFFIFDLVDISNRTMLPSDCIWFEEGHIYHVAPVYMPFSLSYIVFLEHGELKTFDAINCPNAKYKINDVIDYFKQTEHTVKDSKKIAGRLKRYRDFGVYFTMDDIHLQCNIPEEANLSAELGR